MVNSTVNGQQFCLVHIEHMKNLVNGAGIVEQFGMLFAEQFPRDETKNGGSYHQDAKHGKQLSIHLLMCYNATCCNSEYVDDCTCHKRAWKHGHATYKHYNVAYSNIDGSKHRINLSHTGKYEQSHALNYGTGNEISWKYKLQFLRAHPQIQTKRCYCSCNVTCRAGQCWAHVQPIPSQQVKGEKEGGQRCKGEKDELPL